MPKYIDILSLFFLKNTLMTNTNNSFTMKKILFTAVSLFTLTGCTPEMTEAVVDIAAPIAETAFRTFTEQFAAEFAEQITEAIVEGTEELVYDIAQENTEEAVIE